MANRVKERAVSAAIAGKNGYSLISAQKFKLLYATMLKRRLLEQHLQFSGCRAEEAASTAVVIDLRPEDTLILSPGSLLAGFIKGVPLRAIAAHLHARPGYHDFQYAAANVMALTASADTRLGMATGAALASKIAKKDAIAVVFLDGAAQDGATFLTRYREALEIAAKHALPILYIRIADVGSASVLPDDSDARLPVIAVDGSDVVAVYRVAQESIVRARQGSGPTVIEARPFRSAGQPGSHAENAHAGNGQIGSAHAQDDAIMNMEKYLAAKNLFDDAWKQQLLAEFHGQLAAEIATEIVTESKEPSSAPVAG